MMDIMLDPYFKALRIVESVVRCMNATKLTFEYDTKFVILFQMVCFDQLNLNTIAFMMTIDDMGWELEENVFGVGVSIKGACTNGWTNLGVTQANSALWLPLQCPC
jgi:hypothetical protein